MSNKILKAVSTVLFITLVFMAGYNIADVPKADLADSAAYSAETPSFMQKLQLMQTTGDGMTIADIYKKCVPSVALIQVSEKDGEEDFSMASGIILTADGYILTNAHVVDPVYIYDSSGLGNGNKEDYTFSVTLYNDSVYTAEVKAFDTQTDIAVIKIKGSKLPAAEFADSDLIEVGELSVAIGNPFSPELRNTLTVGYISGIRKSSKISDFKTDFLQTDAALNPGNSGGPLINAYGEIIGVNSMKIISYYEGFESLGFAIPSNLALNVADDLIMYGYVRNRPVMGIKVYYALRQIDKDTVGLLIADVNESSDAYKKGLRADDIILAINDVKITKMQDLSDEKDKYQVGDTVTLTVLRCDMEIVESTGEYKGETLKISFKLIEDNPKLK